MTTALGAGSTNAPASKLRLIALVGHAGAGKDSFASFLPGRRFSFAEPLKRFCQQVFAFTDAQAWGSSEHRNAPDPRYVRADGVQLTPRHAMQTLGTEWGRAMHPNIWAEFGVRRAVEWLGPAGTDGPRHAHPLGYCPRPLSQSTCGCSPMAVITDCRFVNEAQEVKKAGGEVWRVFRPGQVLPPAVANHPSETEMDTEPMVALVDRIVMNDGDLDDLKAMAAVYASAFVDSL